MKQKLLFVFIFCSKGKSSEVTGREESVDYLHCSGNSKQFWSSLIRNKEVNTRLCLQVNSGMNNLIESIAYFAFSKKGISFREQLKCVHLREENQL